MVKNSSRYNVAAKQGLPPQTVRGRLSSKARRGLIGMQKRC
jgi:hypothetical protein